MQNNNLPIATEWLKKAQEDSLAAEHLIKDKISFGVVCFLSQQAAEKSLKAFLAYQNAEIPKIHHLGKLLLLCSGHDSNLLKYKEDMILLNEYYIESKYPGDMTKGFDINAAKNALMSAEKIRHEILNKLGI